jgi:hypothetical protein
VSAPSQAATQLQIGCYYLSTQGVSSFSGYNTVSTGTLAPTTCPLAGVSTFSGYYTGTLGPWAATSCRCLHFLWLLHRFLLARGLLLPIHKQVSLPSLATLQAYKWYLGFCNRDYLPPSLRLQLDKVHLAKMLLLPAPLTGGFSIFSGHCTGTCIVNRLLLSTHWQGVLHLFWLRQWLLYKWQIGCYYLQYSLATTARLLQLITTCLVRTTSPQLRE